MHGGAAARQGPRSAADQLSDLPEPEIARPTAPQAILITGVGGTGVVTVGAMLGMAAHLDGSGVGVIDMAGLAQKGGAVSIHMRIGPTPEWIHAIRISAEEADTLLGCDIVVAGSRKALGAIKPGESRVFVNLHETYPGDFTRAADFSLPTRRLRHAIEERAGAGRVNFVEAERLAKALVGDAIATNMLMVGFAWQQGGLPVSRKSILEAIRLNGVEVDMNIAAFEWGRRAAFDLPAAERAAGLTPEPAEASLGDTVARRAELPRRLSEQRAMPAATKGGSSRIAIAEERVAPGSTALALEVAHSLFKLMAIKDEYRGRAALHRRLVREAAARAVRELGAPEVQSCPAAPRPSRQANRTSEETEVRAAGCCPPSGRSRGSDACAARRSTPSAGAPSGGGSAGFSPTTRRFWTRSRRISPPRTSICPGAGGLSAKNPRLRACEAGAGGPRPRRARAAPESIPGAAGKRAARGGGRIARQRLNGRFRIVSQS